MARKIGVYEEGGNSPTTYVKKTVARILVRRLLAVWVVKNFTIRKVSVKDTPKVITRYIPEDQQHDYTILPSGELPGIKVEYPKHRKRFVLGHEFAIPLKQFLADNEL